MQNPSLHLKTIKPITAFIFLVLLISCAKQPDQNILGKWSVNGKNIIENDSTYNQTFASNYTINYEFHADHSFSSSISKNGKWQIKNDSIFFLTSDSTKQVYSIDFKTPSKFVITEQKENLKYVYTFDRREK